MKTNKIIMALAVLMLALVPAMIVATDSDADIHYSNIYQDKITPSGGNLHLVFEYDESSDKEVTIEVIDVANNKMVGSTTITLPAVSEMSKYDAPIHVNFGGIGSYDAKITWTYAGGSDYSTTTIEVTADIWSNWTTYMAIVVIVLLVIIALAVHSRSTPKVKADKTFTELETQKDFDDETPAPRSTERKRYTASPKTEAPKNEVPKAEPVKEAPKKESFTDLEKKKAENSSEPKKLKYISSRRK